ncbi:TlpA family protein disulfide reductase [Lysinibacillus sp. 54212]|uniref:TlpA family protein disulfide reductase n=1 Tax=Lysinibacillus sp. 54212 TaxID=3119829 RepID=UPI002FCA6D1D
MKKWIGIVIIAALIIGLAWNFLKDSEEAAEFGLIETSEPTGLQKGDLPPQFKLETIKEEPMALSDAKGKKVILNFWATWCGPCREEMPALQAYDAANEDVVVVAVNLTDKDGDAEKISKFVSDFNLTFPVLLDQTGDVSKAYEVVNIPSTYFIDEKGIIQTKINGAIDEELIDLYIKQM